MTILRFIIAALLLTLSAGAAPTRSDEDARQIMKWQTNVYPGYLFCTLLFQTGDKTEVDWSAPSERSLSAKTPWTLLVVKRYWQSAIKDSDMVNIESAEAVVWGWLIQAEATSQTFQPYGWSDHPYGQEFILYLVRESMVTYITRKN